MQMYEVILNAYNQKLAISEEQVQWLYREQEALDQDEKDKRWLLLHNIIVNTKKFSCLKETQIEILNETKKYKPSKN